uniref:B30.2/SPRY domain-containing protein n=1 Tax=Hucho hucho TaxID=62062 RepID=A0A4W5NFH1_9TELE
MNGECRQERDTCELTLEPNTAHKLLTLSEENRKITWGKEQPYPDHPARFECYPQVLCREGLTGHCYWEVEWSGFGAYIGVAYKGICRKGKENDSILGHNCKSWTMRCAEDHFIARHSDKTITIPVPSVYSYRVGVYLDWPAGTLSFYIHSTLNSLRPSTQHLGFGMVIPLSQFADEIPRFFLLGF